MGLPWCKRCDHDGEFAFSESCRDCCFGSKYAKKDAFVDDHLRYHNINAALTTWAERAGLSYEDSFSSLDRAINISFKNPRTSRRCEFKILLKCVDDDEKAVENIKREMRKAYMLTPYSKHDDRLVSFALDDVKKAINKAYGLNRKENNMRIKDVVFNGPATIVLWADGTKTVVKAQDGEKIDYEKGLAMAISKKALGNKGNYFEQFKKWLKNVPVEKEEVEEESKPTDRKTVNRVHKKNMQKKAEPTDKEIQANSDAVFADFDKKVTKKKKVK